MEVSFGARFVNKASVVKWADKMPTDIDAAIVELDPKNIGDWYVLEWFAERLSKGNSKANYAENVRDSFNKVMDKSIVDSNLHHYILTSQDSDFEHLSAEKVFGTFMVKDKCKLSRDRLRSLNAQTEYVTKIRFLQGSPENYYGNPNRQYSGIGKAMLDFVKAAFEKYDIVVSIDKSEKAFYEAQKFQQSLNPSADNMMIYRQKRR